MLNAFSVLLSLKGSSYSIVFGTLLKAEVAFLILSINLRDDFESCFPDLVVPHLDFFVTQIHE